MNKRISFLLLMVLITLASCQSPEVSPTFLEGYWEIAEVKGSESKDMTYQASTVLDWYEFTTDSSGIRRKVTPRLDGSFTGSRDIEDFVLRKVDKRLFLTYKSSLMTHTEEVIELTNESLTLKNAEGVLYFYKRFEPIKITP